MSKAFERVAAGDDGSSRVNRSRRFGVGGRRAAVRTAGTAALSAVTVVVLAACSMLSPKPAVTVTVTAPDPGSAASSTSASSAPSITPPASLTTACQLLTLKEAEAIVGTTLSAGQEGIPSNPSCTYNPDPKGTRTAQVLITTGAGAKQTYDTDSRLQHTFTTPSGIGDEAHQERLAIYFRKGTLWAGISLVYLDDPSAVQQPLQQAAAVVASRLP